MIGALVVDAAGPVWADPRFDVAMSGLRSTIDEQIELHQDDFPSIAGRLGLDFEVLEQMASDVAQVQRWVTILAGSTDEAGWDPAVVAVLLSTYLFVDELAYIGMRARAIGPGERAAMMS